jgi:DNA-binding SARP family transcriptional activator
MRLRILGALDLTSAAGAPALEATRQTRLLLACLALAGEKGLTRTELCTLFWPDRQTALARNSLRQGLAAIRRALGDDQGAISLQSDLETVRLSAQAEAVDVCMFRQGLREGSRDSLAEAANAYCGEVLAGVDLPEDIENFVTANRRTLNGQAQELVERLSKADGADGKSLNAVQALADRLLQSDPTSEAAHRALMRTHLHRGRANAALRQFEECKATLQRELQAEPDPETRGLLDTFRTFKDDDAQQRANNPMAINTAGPYPSVAIMPFDNLGDPSDAYFVDGVVEEIASTLSRIRDFFVIARQSTFTFKGRFVDVREVGRTLGVAYLVEARRAATASG